MLSDRVCDCVYAEVCDARLHVEILGSIQVLRLVVNACVHLVLLALLASPVPVLHSLLSVYSPSLILILCTIFFICCIYRA